MPLVGDPGGLTPKDARALSKHFFDQLTVLEEGTPEYQYARNTLIEMNMSLVRYAARRFRHRCDDMEDVVQVGMIGLIKAIDRFELSRDVQFVTFAVPYIIGEIKRFLRDTSWAVHVPRRLQEARLELAKATDELSTRLGRAPTVSELAALMNLTEDEVIGARLAANGYNSTSLDVAINGDHEDGEAALANFIGAEDPAMELVEDLHSLAPLVPDSATATRRSCTCDSSRNSQSQIGERLGISQMHVSRLLSQTLARLRKGMLTPH
ncbi:SigB/SigF/SigG family RNA polymerase sigma factor [Streptomyces ficellus]|uniref:SigB/SigF/SigG family RNA polymerase sigma factor n=1 Tax=Streptomyces ficellus TaxID=1977088 RepID=A0ABT7ZAX2_9ACTN|nr:SigB/SigF/SigG family RNA polymerase sigma factor [Streptomyces ficellus]MDN3296588.1 SigB/SigF/SigG family RNA polymerase sigma factor [Streptomyces ficellus]